jgi:uncharacterized BrkB/YihY/UPF0761 family membrane protein
MRLIGGILGYLGIGLFWMLLAIVLNKKFKLNIFWEHDPWSGWSRNGFEFAIVLGWVLFVPVSAIMGLCFLFYRICTPFIGKEPSDEKEENDLYNHLLSKGVDKSEAADIAKEIEEIVNGG